MLRPESNDTQMASVFQQYWSNFAKSGSPNDAGAGDVDGAASLAAWPKYTTKEGGYMQMDLPPKPSTNLDKDACDFWDSLPRMDGYPTVRNPLP